MNATNNTAQNITLFIISSIETYSIFLYTETKSIIQGDHMQKIIYFLIIMLTSNTTYTMKKSQPAHFFTRDIETDSNGNTVEVDNMILPTEPEETYNRYFYNLVNTTHDDDTWEIRRVSKPFFMHLCVQASKERRLDQKPFQELVAKVKIGSIDISQDSVVMTTKDASHRLLSYIPRGSFHCLVNNKHVHIALNAYETESDKVINSILKKEAETKNIVQDELAQHDNKSRIRKVYRPLFQPQLTGYEITTMLDHDFTRDIPHHKQVVNEFNKLLE